MKILALPVLALLAAQGTALAQNADWPKSLTLTTASPGGTFSTPRGVPPYPRPWSGADLDHADGGQARTSC
jgi:hypothetical protein